jgi:hypothetical protein
MFPDKIGRLVVDGVMDVEDYFTVCGRYASSHTKR